MAFFNQPKTQWDSRKKFSYLNQLCATRPANFPISTMFCDTSNQEAADFQTCKNVIHHADTLLRATSVPKTASISPLLSPNKIARNAERSCETKIPEIEGLRRRVLPAHRPSLNKFGRQAASRRQKDKSQKVIYSYSTLSTRCFPLFKHMYLLWFIPFVFLKTAH